MKHGTNQYGANERRFIAITPDTFVGAVNICIWGGDNHRIYVFFVYFSSFSILLMDTVKGFTEEKIDTM
jgi:hypothetical protein